MKKKRYETWLYAISILVLTYLLVNNNTFLKYQPFVLNVSTSMPIGLYLKIPTSEYKEGDIVIYTPSDKATEYLIKNDIYKEMDFIKIIGGLEGTNYSINEETRQFLVRDKYIGQARIGERKYKLPTHFGNHVVSNGEFLPITYDVYSYDGRYFGTEKLDRIKYRVIPIITEWKD